MSLGYDSLFSDLDGVVYRGRVAVDHAVVALNRFGGRCVFVTNNSSRPVPKIADQLRGFGLNVADADIVTSGQAAAEVAADVLGPGARVLVTGGQGLREAVADQGLSLTDSADEALAVVQGGSPSLTWRDLAEASYALARDIPWIVSNTDLTFPTARGIAPGSGTMVAAVATTTGRVPTVVTGKPHTPIMDLARRRSHGARPLVVGDRLDTDIAAATNAGMDSLLVLTGVTHWQDLLNAPPEHLPTIVAPDLRILQGHRDEYTAALANLLDVVRSGGNPQVAVDRLHELAQAQQVPQ